MCKLAFWVFLLIPSLNAWADSDRVIDGLQVLYAFDEGEGDVVHDR